MLAFIITPIGRQFAAVALVAIACFAIAFWLMGKGADRATQKIEKQDKSAISAAHDARSIMRQCVDSGRLWHTETGKCEGR